MNDQDTHDEAREKPHPLELGHRLAEFELIEVIGEGGFGIVYRAYDHSLQREVAVKEYMPSMLARRVGDNSVHVRSERLSATFQAGLRSFINEARTLAQFSHPALVRVHRFWESNSTAYMAIQLYKGRTLRRLADEEPGRITEAWLLTVVGPLLGALETLHRSQCFHRDIAPDNIFIQQDDLPVLLDFGAARKSIADLVDEVAVMVKSGYSPIEQYADDNTLLQGPWTDLYALGAVLYRAVTGHPPPSAVVRSVQDAYVPLSSLHRADLSPAFCAAVDHTLAVHSKDRTPSVAAFAAELGLVKLGDIYVSGMGVPATLIAAAPVSSTPPPPPLAPQDFAPMSAPAPLDAMASGAFVAPPAAVAEPVRSARAEAHAAATAAAKAPKKAGSRTPWAAVAALVVALVAVGSWIGYRLTSGGAPPATTAMAPVPPQGTPMSNAASPPAVMPSGTTGALPDAPPATASNTPLTPLANVPVNTPPPATGAPAPTAGAAPATTAATTGTPPATVATLTPAATTPATANATTPGVSGSTPSATAMPVPGTTPPDTPLASAELDDWTVAQDENTREGYEAYLRRYRRGLHARDARNAIAELNKLSPADPGAPVAATPVAGTTSAAAPPGMGRILFNVRPWGQVFVDGADRGVSPPLKSLALRPGIYNIEVRNGDLDVFRQRVTVQDSKSAPVVSYEFK